MTEVLHREYSVELHAGDGRTVDVRIVPYATPAQVSDGGPVYREEWAEGAFDEQLVTGHRLRVLLNFEHEEGIGGVIGKGVSLRSASNGLHGSFRLLESQSGDTALELVRDGILAGVSLEAVAKQSVRTAQGVIRRVRAHLRNVALCRDPAYKDAVVLAVREASILEERLLLGAPDPELLARCRALGVRVPQRYEAHPPTGTPSAPGTPAETPALPVTTSQREHDGSEHIAQ